MSPGFWKTCSGVTDRLLHLEAEVARLREALGPFARCTYQGDGTAVVVQTSLIEDADWIRARAALGDTTTRRAD